MKFEQAEREEELADRLYQRAHCRRCGSGRLSPEEAMRLGGGNQATLGRLPRRNTENPGQISDPWRKSGQELREKGANGHDRRPGPRPDAEARGPTTYYDGKRVGVGGVFLSHLADDYTSSIVSPKSFGSRRPPVPGRNIRRLSCAEVSYGSAMRYFQPGSRPRP